VITPRPHITVNAALEILSFVALYLPDYKASRSADITLEVLNISIFTIYFGSTDLSSLDDLSIRT
jgi:hypothetical protein